MGLVAAAVVGVWKGPGLVESFGTVSTDDAYVSGHATFVASRVSGQVAKVLVDDNNRVRAGDLLVQLDKEPFQVQVEVAEASVDVAQADVRQALAQARGIEGQMRSSRFALQRAIEDVDNQVAVLRSRVANLNVQKSELARVRADFDRANTADKGSLSIEEIDHRKQSVQSAEAVVEQALQQVYQSRVSLGLPGKPENGEDLASVPADLTDNFSAIRQAQANLVQAAAQIGVSQSLTQTPKDMIAEFYKRDPEGNLDRIYDALLKDAPIVKQAQAKLLQAQRNLEQARLNLRYCDVFAEIDGVVVRRAVNPGNNVIAGQELMVVRSLTDIWIDANFKETQIRRMRIGQPVDIDVDMYGSSMRFKGRVSGFAMGTGSTLALLPAENATGNFVKVVQRLPVRIDLVGYNPDQNPLFVGLSVTPRVHIDSTPTGVDGGSMLQHSVTSGPLPAPIKTPGTAADVKPAPGAGP